VVEPLAVDMGRASIGGVARHRRVRADAAEERCAKRFITGRVPVGRRVLQARGRKGCH